MDVDPDIYMSDSMADVACEKFCIGVSFSRTRTSQAGREGAVQWVHCVQHQLFCSFFVSRSNDEICGTLETCDDSSQTHHFSEMWFASFLNWTFITPWVLGCKGVTHIGARPMKLDETRQKCASIDQDEICRCSV